MCGIAGLLNYRSQALAEAEILHRMLNTITHRGPDDEGVLVDGELAMGMRRLSIIDLAEGHQPIFDEQRRYAVVFNGEIYNYRELQQELRARGHRLATNSDTEVIVHLYEELGARCVEHLRGMFSFAIWDSQARSLFIARDRLGIKPLYFVDQQGKLIFASLKTPIVRAALDRRALSEFLSLKYVPAPRTLFEGVHSLRPGHFMLVRDGQLEIQQYWDVSFAKVDNNVSQEDARQRLMELLRESVKLRLRSDVPFGAFLSGGLDSSTIVALMSEQLGSPVKTFSVGFDGPEMGDELPYAQQVADRFRCDHHTLRINVRDFLEHAEQVLWHLDQPIADQATVATYMVAKLASKHVKMVLTGEGGDELFAGYARYAGEQFGWIANCIPNTVGGWWRCAVRHLPGLRRAKIALQALSMQNEAVRFANWFPMFQDDTKEMLLTGAMQEFKSGVGELFEKFLQQCDAREPLNRMLYLDTKLWLPDYLLLRGDKLTMANSIEGRVPLLDHKIVEFAATLPTQFKLSGNSRKVLLRQVAAELLPPEILNRKKQGFPIPIEKWLRFEAKDMMCDLLHPDTLKRRGLFDANFVGRLVQQHLQGYADHATELWGLMNVEMWIRQYIESPSASPPTLATSH